MVKMEEVYLGPMNSRAPIKTAVDKKKAIQEHVANQFKVSSSRKGRRKNREAIESARRQNEYNNIEKQNSALPSESDTQELMNRADKLSNAETERQRVSREGFRKEALNDLQTPVQGLTPSQKQAMQETASKQINSQLGNYSRKLAGQSGSRGVRGGAANALQTELQQQGLEASNQFNRDLTERDADLALQKLAAYMSTVEGRNAQDIIQRQQNVDYLTGDQEKRRQNAYQSYFNKYFNKV